MFIPFTFIVEEARSHGMSERMAQYLVPILNGARLAHLISLHLTITSKLTILSIFGRTVPNAIADKVGRFNMMIVMSTFTTIVLLGLWLPATGNVPLIIFAALFGIGSGAGIGLTPALCAGISPMKDIGVRTGTIFAVSSIAALTGSPLGGRIITDSKGDFKNTIIFAGISCAIGTVLFLSARIVVGGVKMGKV